MMQIIPLHPGLEDAFYALCAEYLPDSDPAQMHAMQLQYPASFLAVTDDAQLIGAAFGWPRALVDPTDASFTLGGIVIHWDHQHQGHGKRLLAAFEQAAKGYGAPAVSAGSAGGYVEAFYIGCGYRPKAYKTWQDGRCVVEKAFVDMADYHHYQRLDPDGFVVMEKEI